MKALTEFIAKSLVEHPEDVAVEEIKTGNRVRLERANRGKVLAQRTIPELESVAEPKLAHDSSTNNLIRRYRGLRKTL